MADNGNMTLEEPIAALEKSFGKRDTLEFTRAITEAAIERSWKNAIRTAADLAILSQSPANCLLVDIPRDSDILDCQTIRFENRNLIRAGASGPLACDDIR